jgi:hypothetical protein
MPSDTESSSFYRGLGPLYRLSRRYPGEFDVIRKREFNWSDFIEPHVAFLLRPGSPQHVSLIKRLKAFGVRVVIDWDDDIFAIHHGHPDFDQLSNDELRNSVVACAQLADEIWVTTPRLREVFEQFVDAARIQVIPNAIDDVMYPEPTAPRPGDGIEAICWRGSKTHVADILASGEWFLQGARHGKRFIFMGYKPFNEMDIFKVPRGSWTNFPIQDIDSFFGTLKRLNSAFHVTPLEDNLFNRAKSNIAYLEAAWIGGSLPIVPEFWKELHGALSIGTDPVKFWMETGVIDEKERHFHVASAQRHIRENYLLSTINETRRDRFRKLRESSK